MKLRCLRQNYFKRYTLLAVFVCLVFMWYRYDRWGYWSSSYYLNFKGCSESIYNFNKYNSYFSDPSVDSDKKLKDFCHLLEKFERQQKTKIFKLINKNKTAMIFTKCLISQPTLISKHQSETSNASAVGKMLFDRYNNDLLNTKDSFKVPNIVHYTTIGSWEFSFLNYLSFLSVQKFIQPAAIFVHGDQLPHGTWWNKTLQDVHSIYYVVREIPQRIQGVRVGWLEHSSDILRLQTLMDNGGIYLDTDILVLKSFDNLRTYPLTLGRETKYGLGSGIILSTAHSEFLCMWFQSFRDYRPYPWNWATYAVWTPSKLARKYPHLIHIEEHTLQKPSWNQPDLLFNENQYYNWSKNYAIHIWKHYGDVPNRVEDIVSLNSTLGQVMRYIYFGSSKMVPVVHSQNFYRGGKSKEMHYNADDNVYHTKGRQSDGFHVNNKGKSHRKYSLRVIVDLLGDKILNLFGF